MGRWMAVLAYLHELTRKISVRPRLRLFSYHQLDIELCKVLPGTL